MKHQITTKIIINRSPEIVWAIFTKFEEYPNWNPFIKSIEGEIKVGQKFNAEIGSMKFKPVTQVFNPEREFTWLGKLILPGLFDGRHSFLFKSNTDGTTTLVHKESFRGILVPLLKKKLNTEIKQGFESMNLALKELVEKDN